MLRLIEIDTPLGQNVLLPRTMSMHDELGRPFRCQVNAVSTAHNISPDKLLGHNATIRLELQKRGLRYINGYITGLTITETFDRYFSYTLTIRPWLWLLTRTRNCRIFQNKTVIEIVTTIFNDYFKIASYDTRLTDNYPKRTYCIQYRETDFDFISRLLEHEGIYYYFEHSEGRHTLVLADSISSHPRGAADGKLSFISPGRPERLTENHVSGWESICEIQPVTYVLRDFDFEKPNAELTVQATVKREHELAAYQIFDYPGEYTARQDGDRCARTRIEEIGAQHQRSKGITSARALTVGQTFYLENHPRPDQNGEYLVVSANYELRTNDCETNEVESAYYKCNFSALTSKTNFRPKRETPKPIIHGPQTAIVVGPKNETIYTDKYGRVKVHFHWDRYGVRDENSTCWIRVSQAWGGKGWGSMFIPHVGQEVIVQFLEGDPDAPIVTGRVYNSDNMPPVALPAGKSKSIIRDHGGNEIVMEGISGGQQMRLFSPKHNTAVTLGNSYRLFTESHKTEEVQGDQRQHTQGNHDQVVGGSSTREVGVDWFEIIAGKHKVEVGGDLLQFYGGITNRVFVGATSTLLGGYKFEAIGGWETKTIAGAQKTVVRGCKTEIISGTTYKIHAGDAREWRNSSSDEKTPAERRKVGDLKEIYGRAKAQVDGDYKLKVAAELSTKANKTLFESENASYKAVGKMDVKANSLLQQAVNLYLKASDMQFKAGKCVINDGTLSVK